jgi:hypothetical protein
MRKIFTDDHHYQHNFYTGDGKHKSYGFLSFMGDLFMIMITGGLWLLWIFVREMRR